MHFICGEKTSLFLLGGQKTSLFKSYMAKSSVSLRKSGASLPISLEQP